MKKALFNLVCLLAVVVVSSACASTANAQVGGGGGWTTITLNGGNNYTWTDNYGPLVVGGIGAAIDVTAIDIGGSQTYTVSVTKIHKDAGHNTIQTDTAQGFTLTVGDKTEYIPLNATSNNPNARYVYYDIEVTTSAINGDQRFKYKYTHFVF